MTYSYEPRGRPGAGIFFIVVVALAAAASLASVLGWI